ncbi:MAG: PAS sensor protein [Aequorivita sp.]|nr:PAS sensor protein [Aequorivita sp.]|tara:strand:- start:6043 stop:9171 length:3129 start_codon:yes stop_codon:yes gene_type:complete
MANKKEDNFPDRIMFDLYPFPMWIYDVETLQFLAVNKEAIKHYGYTEEEFLTMKITDIRPPEEIPKLLRSIKSEETKTDKFALKLFLHQKKDGSLMNVQIKSSYITYNNKKADLVTAIDLTKQYQQEQRIREQKQYLSIIGELNQLLLKTDDWVEALDRCFQIVGETLDVDRIYFFENDLENNTTSQRLEWTRNTNQTQIDNPHLQNVSYNKFPVLLNPLRDGEKFEAIISQLPPSDTKEILKAQNIASILILPVMINNEFCGFIGVDDCENDRNWSENENELLKNLTSNLGHVIKDSRSHQKLKESEARFRSLVHNGSDLIAIVNKEGVYTYVASTSIKVLGIPPEDFIGNSAFDFISDEDTPRLLQYLEDILAGKEVKSEPFRLLDANNNWRWIQSEFTNHLDNPAIQGIVVNSKDVTAEVEEKMGKEIVASLTKAIGSPGALTDCLNDALKKLVKISGIHISEVWLISEDKQQLNLVAKAYKDKSFEAFHDKSKNVHSFIKGKGLPGHTWNSKQTTLWENLKTHDSFIRNQAAELLDLDVGMGIPIVFNDEFLGCITCFSKFSANYLTDIFKLLNEIGTQIGAVVKQKITEEEYRNFFDIAPDPHCLLGFDGYIKKLNHAFKEVLGYSEKEILSSPIFKFIHPEDSGAFKENLIANAQSINLQEVRIISKDGNTKWLRWSASLNPDVKIIIAVAKNITEQKLAEQELEAAYHRLQNANKIAKLGYWSRNLTTNLSEWSDEMYTIYGQSPTTFTPTLKNIENAFHPADKDLFVGPFPDRLQSGAVQSFEHRIITAANETRWVRQEVRLIKDKDGEPLRLEGTLLDITESKEYQQQLAQSNERFAMAMRVSNEMIWEIDHIKNKVSRGKGYVGAFNYDASEPFVKNNSWFNKVHPDDLEELWQSLQQTIHDTNKKSWEMEYRIFAEDNSIAYFVDRCYIIRDEEGNALRSIGSALDVTNSRLQLEQIKRQNKNLREIAWLQSHVIRAPLSKIMGLVYISELENNDVSPEEIFKMISGAAQELDEVIHEITHKINTFENKES